MALSMGTVQHAQVVPGHDESQIHHLDESADTPRGYLALLRLLHIRVARIVLAWRDPDALLPPYAKLREQPPPSETRNARRRRFQPEHLVARPASGDGVG